jgi:hypothetical protein
MYVKVIFVLLRKHTSIEELSYSGTFTIILDTVRIYENSLENRKLTINSVHISLANKIDLGLGSPMNYFKK